MAKSVPVDVEYVLKAQEKADKELAGATGKDITVLVGPTRAGKSTLINYLLGHELEVKYSKIEGIKFSTTKGGAKIFHGAESGTSFPVFCGNLGARQLWDIPGLNDTAGGTNELSNTFYIINLLKRANSAQVFLVIDFDSLNIENPNAFHQFLDSAVNTFSDLGNFQFYFTKVPMRILNHYEEAVDITDQYIAQKLETIKESVDKVSTNYSTGDNQTKVKEFLASVIEGKGWQKFPKPTPAEFKEEVYKPVSLTTLQSVKDSPSIPKSKLEKIKLSISSDIKDALKTKQGKMIGQYRTKAEEIVKSVSDEYTTKINSSNLTTLKTIHEKLGEGAKSFKQKKHIEALKKLAEGISQTIDTQKLSELEKSIEDIQKLLPPPTTAEPSQETPSSILEKELSREFTTVSGSIRTKENGIHDTNYETAKTEKKAKIELKQKEIDEYDGRIVTWTGVKKFGAGTAGAVGGLVIAPVTAVGLAVKGVKGDKSLGITNSDDSVTTKVVKAPVSAVTGAAVGLLGSAPALASTAVYRVTDNTREKLWKEKAGLQTELKGITKTASSLSLIDFSIPNTDGASSSGTNREVSCILGMEYENEILNYPEVLKVLTDSLAINYSDILDKVGGFDQEFVREACLSGNVELLEECFGN